MAHVSNVPQIARFSCMEMWLVSRGQTTHFSLRVSDAGGGRLFSGHPGNVSKFPGPSTSSWTCFFSHNKKPSWTDLI